MAAQAQETAAAVLAVTAEEVPRELQSPGPAAEPMAIRVAPGYLRPVRWSKEVLP